MKELSIEEKAKRYDEAIERAKRNYDTIIQMDKDCTFAKEGIVNTFHRIFPELAESEDERIRNEIIDYLERFIPHHEYDLVAQSRIWIDWLKKQGERKEIDYNEELKKCRANPLYFFDKYVKVKLNERKPAWSEEDEERYVSCLQRLGTGNLKQPETINTVWLKSLKERVQLV